MTGREVDHKEVRQQGEKHAENQEGLINKVHQPGEGQGTQSYASWQHMDQAATSQRASNDKMITALQGGEGHTVSDQQIHSAVKANDVHVASLGAHMASLNERIQNAHTSNTAAGNQRSRA